MILDLDKSSICIQLWLNCTSKHKKWKMNIKIVACLKKIFVKYAKVDKVSLQIFRKKTHDEKLTTQSNAGFTWSSTGWQMAYNS